MKRNRTNGKKAMCIWLTIAMVMGAAGCGSKEVEQESVITPDNQEQVLNEVLNGQVKASHSSDVGKEETVYVLADANGKANQVIVNDWLKNGNGGSSLLDSTDLVDIQNVKGYETFETDADGNIIWQADGSDIYYRGNSDKEVPVEVKISYLLDGKEIAPDELAGKSGRVTIRMDYENKEIKKVTIGGKEQEIKVPFAMISGMILPQDTFSNIEVTNARLLSEGNNSVVIGVAFPGLKESIQIEELKDKVEDEEQKEKLEDMKIPDYIEISADTENFELGMTMTVAMSDILSDIEMTDSFNLSALNDSMDELRDATDQIKDGTVELKDGSGKLKDGTGELLAGTNDLLAGTMELKDGTQELFEKSGLLNDGAMQLNDGAAALYDGSTALFEGGKKLEDGTESLVSGMRDLNDGAGQVKGGVEQVAAGMNTLKTAIGTPVNSLNGTPTTLLELSYALNQSIRSLDNANGARYDAIVKALLQQKQQAASNQEAAQANAAEAQGRAAAAQAEMMAACAGSTEQIEVVTGSHTETESNTETWEESEEGSVEAYAEEDAEDDSEEGGSNETAVVYTRTYIETVTTEREVADTEVKEVQTVDVENLQQRIADYQDALEDVATYQAQAEAYAMQIESIDAEINAINDSASQALDPYTQTVALGINMQKQLEEISKQLNASASGLTVLLKGAGDLANGTQTALSGATELNNGASELAAGAGSLRDGAAALKDGTIELKDGTNQLVEGTESLNDGAGTLKDGVNTLKDGVLTLDEGMGTLDEGALELVDGMFKFDEEGISKLTELFGDDVQDVVDRLQAVADAGKEYNTFTKLPEDVDGSVKFIIKTEAVR